MTFRDFCKEPLISFKQCNEAGIKEKNDDACGIIVPPEPVLTDKGIAAVIADGVSSSEGGREASEICVQGFLSDYFSTPDSWTAKTSGQRVLGALNRWLHGKGQHVFGHAHGMITTLSAMNQSGVSESPVPRRLICTSTPSMENGSPRKITRR